MDGLMATETQTRWFADLIREEGLADPAQFLKDGFFDEIPFYSRYDQLPPAEAAGHAEVDVILIKSCLDYLDRLLSNGRPTAPLLAAITVVREGRGEPIIPSLFACYGLEQVQSALRGLPLLRPRSSLGLHLGKMLKTIGASDGYGLLQDSATVPGRPRIFIVGRHPPFPEVIGLDELRGRPGLRIDDGRPSPSLAKK